MDNGVHHPRICIRLVLLRVTTISIFFCVIGMSAHLLALELGNIEVAHESKPEGEQDVRVHVRMCADDVVRV